MRRTRLSWLLVAVLLCSGCGYSSRSLIDERYRTVYVKTFDNLTFYRGFEFELSRALVNEINAKTHLRIVPMNQAQTLLEGRIVGFKQNVLTEDVDDNVRELEITLVVDMTWTDLATNRQLRKVNSFTETAQAKFDIGENLESATAEAFADIAERLVNELEAEW